MLGTRPAKRTEGNTSLVPRPSITANAVKGLVKLLCRMMSGGCLEAWLSTLCTAVHRKCHASRRPPNIILRRIFTRPFIALAVIEGLGMRLDNTVFRHN